jgi:diacylglycerol kinase family enzyme
MSQAPAALQSSPESLPPEHGVAVVVNGNAKNVTHEVISNLDQILRGTDLYVSRDLEQAREIAETVVRRGYATVLTGGGDGTFMVMVTEIVRAAERAGRPLPRFGFIKLGTGNALAYVVGASGRRRLSADIRRLREQAGSRRIGLVEVEGSLTPFCGLGADAAVLLDYARLNDEMGALRPITSGLFGYVVSSLTRTLPQALSRDVPRCRLINRGADAFKVGPGGLLESPGIGNGGVLYDGPARIVGVSTIPYYGFGLKMFPYAEQRKDRMSVRIATLTPGDFVLNARAIWKGEYKNPERVHDFLVEAADIEMDPPTPFQIGGDLKGERSLVHVQLSHRPIRLVDFYAPPRPGAGRAAKRDSTGS